MITLHLLEQSRAHRILWLLELLPVQYSLKIYKRDSKTLLAPESLKKIHPLGKSPILQDGEMILTESGAIVDYLVQTYGNGKLMPARDSQKYWEYQRYLHYSEGSIMPLMLVALIFQQIENARMPFFVRPIARKIIGKVRENFLTPQISLHLATINTALSQQKFLLGEELSGADIMMSFALFAVEKRHGLEEYPHLEKYLRRLEQDAAFIRASEKVGAVML